LRVKSREQKRRSRTGDGRPGTGKGSRESRAVTDEVCVGANLVFALKIESSHK